MADLAEIDQTALRQRIDSLELLDSILAAAKDVTVAEFQPGETLRLSVEAKDGAVAFVHGVPPEMLAAALRYMALGIPA